MTVIAVLVGFYLVLGAIFGVAALGLRSRLLHQPVPEDVFPAPMQLLLGESGRGHARFVALSLVAWPYVGLQVVRVERALTRLNP